MFTKAVAKCPVCESQLGYITKGEVCSFVCRDCQWIFTWDVRGGLTAPVKLEEKRQPETCDCGSCQARDERKRLKRRDFF